MKSINKLFEIKFGELNEVNNFINEYLEKYNVERINEIPISHNDSIGLVVTILYEEKDDVISKEILLKAFEVMYESNRVSINYLQNELKIGFNKASLLISRLKELGVIKENKELIDLNEAKIIINNLED